MKKVYFFLPFIFLFILSSCGKDEPEINMPPSKVSGIEVEVVGETEVKITWEPSEDVNKDEVSYNVIVNSNIVATKTSETSLNLDLTPYLPANKLASKGKASKGLGIELTVNITAFDDESNVSDPSEVVRYVYINRNPNDFDFVGVNFDFYNYRRIDIEWLASTDDDNDILSYDVLLNDELLVENYIIGSNSYSTNGTVSVDYDFSELLDQDIVIKVMANDRSGGVKEISRTYNFRATDVDLGTLTLPYNQNTSYTVGEDEADRIVGYNFTITEETGISVTDRSSYGVFYLREAGNGNYINSGSGVLNIMSIQPGDYYLEFRSYSNAGTEDSGTFTMNLRNAFETDSEFDISTLPFSENVDLEILNTEPDSRVEYLFEVTETTSYSFESNSSIYLNLLDVNKNTISSGYGRLSGIISTPGTYYVSINNQYSNQISSETLRVNFQEFDVIDLNENLGTVSVPFARFFDYDTTDPLGAGEAVINFTIQTNASYLFETVSADHDTVLELLDGSGRRINYDDDSGSGALSRMSGNLSPGNYSLVVKGYNNRRGAGVLSFNLN